MVIQAIIHVYSQEGVTLRGPVGPETPSLWWKTLASCPVLQVPSAASHQLRDRPPPKQLLLLMAWSSRKRTGRGRPFSCEVTIARPRPPLRPAWCNQCVLSANNITKGPFLQQSPINMPNSWKGNILLSYLVFFLNSCRDISHLFPPSSFLLLTLEGLPESGESGLI